MNVVLIRGTSGSGKTYIAEQVIARAGGLDKAQAIRFDNPEKPIEKWRTGAYAWDKPPLIVMGRYDSACGGCDCLSWPGAADPVEQFVTEQSSKGQAVLLEGLTVSSYGKERLKRIPNLTVIHLTTPLEECIESVRARRVAAGKDPTFNVENTKLKYQSVLTGNAGCRKLGIKVESLNREKALARVMELLGL